MDEIIKTPPLPIIDLREPIALEDIKSNIRDLILEGRIDAAKVGVVLKKMERTATELLKEEKVKDMIVGATEQYLSGQKSTVLFGATITRAAIYTTYDFSECNHPELDELYKIRDNIDDRIKLIEEELKLLIDNKNSDITPNDGKIDFGIKTKVKNIIIESIPTLVEQASGEVAEVKAPIKKQKMGIKYSKL